MLDIRYNDCLQCTILTMYLQEIPVLFLEIPDEKYIGPVQQHVNWLMEQPTIRKGIDAVQIEITKEVARVMNQVKWLYDKK